MNYRDVQARVLTTTPAWIAAIATLLVTSSAWAAGTASIFDDDWVPRSSAPAAQAPSAATSPQDSKPATDSGVHREPNGKSAAVADAPPPRAGNTSAIQRLPIPLKADRVQSRKILDSAFAKELLNTTPLARRALAERLFQEALKVRDVPSDAFELLAGAVQAAKEGSDLRLCIKAADALGSTYDIDSSRIVMLAALGMKFRTDPAAFQVENCRAALQLIDQRIAAGDDDTAEKLLNSIRGAAAADSGLRAEVAERTKQVQTTRQRNDRMSALLLQEKGAPNDGAVQLQLGEELCFNQSQWQDGLPHLARSSDDELKVLATRDLTSPALPAEMSKLGNDWWDAAIKRQGASKDAMQSRGYRWLAAALPQLRGLSRTAALNRLHESPFMGATTGRLATFAGHEGTVNAVAFTPDGRSFLSCGNDGTIRLRDLITGEEVRRFEGHSGAVGRLSVPLRGNVFVSAGSDGTVRFWNSDSEKEMHRFTYNDNCQSSISPDGRFAVVAANLAGPFLYATDSFKSNPAFHSEGNYASAWSPTGQLVATGGWNHVVHILDSKSLKEIHAIKSPDQIYFIVFTPDGRRVLSGLTRMVHISDVLSGRDVASIETSGTIHTIAITPDSHFALIAGEQPTLTLYDLDSGQPSARFEGRQTSVTAVAISHDGRFALSGDVDGNVRLWRLPGNAEN